MSVSTMPFHLMGWSDPLVEGGSFLFVWGGILGFDGVLDKNVGTATITIDGTGGDNYLNVLLDTRTDPHFNNFLPSWGTMTIEVVCLEEGAGPGPSRYTYARDPGPGGGDGRFGNPFAGGEFLDWSAFSGLLPRESPLGLIPLFPDNVNSGLPEVLAESRISEPWAWAGKRLPTDSLVAPDLPSDPAASVLAEEPRGVKDQRVVFLATSLSWWDQVFQAEPIPTTS